MTLFTTCWTSFELWTASASMGRRPAAARRGISFLLLGLHAVLRARLLAVRNAGGVEGAAGDLPQSRVRLLRRGRVDACADSAPLGSGKALLATLAGLEARSRDLALGL